MKHGFGERSEPKTDVELVPMSHSQIGNLKDHLGNTRVVVKPATNPGHATVLQETNYFPFGMRISQLCSTFVASTDNRYLYNGKELQDDFGLNWGVYPAESGNYGARFYDPSLGRFHSVDNSSEYYYSCTPYAYVANNPMIFVDPDGNVLIIWYNNNQNSCRYTGGNVKHSNAFVNNVIKAYNYNVSNGGGVALKSAATDRSVSDGISEAIETQSVGQYVYWNTEMGLQTSEGDVLSPATVLEHEVDHSYDTVKNPKDNEDRHKTKDSNYGNKEERRVITGNETKTAKANGEIGNKNVSRNSHSGNSRVAVKGGVTSTTVDQQNSIELQKKLDDDRSKRLSSER